MIRALVVALAMVVPVGGAHAETAADAAALTKQLNEFLVGASRNDPAAHDRFWAEDLIYPGSSGRRVGKADIMRDVRATPAPKDGEPRMSFTAEDVRIHQYGSTAVVAFRLVGTTTRDGMSHVGRYLNTGTFLKQKGEWRAVSWQATRLPRLAEEADREVAAAGAAFHRALREFDRTKLALLTDTSFVWTDGAGENMSRRHLLDDLGSGTLGNSAPESDSVTVSVRGDAAVARGAHDTILFVNQDGDWKAWAMYSSRP